MRKGWVMKPTAFNYSDYARLQIEVEKKNEYTNALIAENKRLQKQLDAAVEDINKIAACDVCKHYDADKNSCDNPYVNSTDCFEWRGAERGGENG